MTQYPPKTFFLQRIFQAIEVVLQNLQTRGPNAGGGGIFTILPKSRYYKERNVQSKKRQAICR